MTGTHRSFALISVLGALLFGTSLNAELRTIRLLPDDTVAYWVASDVSKLAEKIEQMNLWGVEQSPTFQTVLRHFEETHLQRWSGTSASWRGILKAGTGEACLAVRKTKAGSPSTILLVEVDAGDATNSLLASLAPLSKVVMEDVGGKFGIDLKLYFNPADETRFLYFVKDDIFVAVGDDNSPKMLLSSWPGENALLKLKAHQKVMERCTDSATPVPDIRWFIKPVDYVAMSVPRDQPVSLRGPNSSIRRASQTGFGSFEAIGGTLNLADGPNAFIARTMIYAPDRETPVMRIAPLPNGDWHAPPVWAPRNLQGFTSLFWSLRDSKQGLGEVIDNVLGAKGAWEDVKKAMYLNPSAPRVDLDKNLIPHVGGRVFILSGPPTERDGITGRGLVAVELSNAETVAETISKIMDNDSDANPLQVAGVRFWKYDSKAKQLEVLRFEGIGLPFDEPEEVIESRWLDRYYVGVANGYLIIGDNEGLLKQVLGSDTRFRNDCDFQRVRSQLRSLLPDPVSVSSFSRNADDFRLDARLSWLISRVQSWEPPLTVPTKEPTTDSPELNWSPSLGPGGWAAKREKDGWFAVAIAQPSASDIPVVTESPITQRLACRPTCCRIRRPLFRCVRMRIRRCRR